MNINAANIRPQTNSAVAAQWELPLTLSNVPDSVARARDEAFSLCSGLLAHTLPGLELEGYPAFVGYGVLSQLAQNGLIRAGVEMRAKEMTRQWGEFARQGDEETADADEQTGKLAALEQAARKFKLPQLFRKAAASCGYFGGCLVFIDTGAADEDLANPLTLSPATFPVGGLRALRLIDPFLVTPGLYNAVNPLSSDYFKPSLWYIQGIPVHASRLLYFAENELPTVIRPVYNFFGLPLAQTVLDAVSHFTQCRESAARLLQKYSLTVFKTDMNSVLSGGFDQNLQNRIRYFVQNRDSDGVATIDKEGEDLIVMTTSLAGVTDVVRQSMEYVAAMFNEPVVKMWGLSPNGFNSGEADLRNHYDNIASLQEQMFGEPMARLTRVLQMNEFGEIDEAVCFQFAPLSVEDERSTAEANKIKAETAAVYVDMGTLSAEEVRDALISDPDSGYNDLPPAPPMGAGMEALEPFEENADEITADGGPGSGRKPEGGSKAKKKAQSKAGANTQRQGICLPKKEYGKVVSELNTNLSKKEFRDGCAIRYIGNYKYTVEINDFGDYIFLAKKRIR